MNLIHLCKVNTMCVSVFDMGASLIHDKLMCIGGNPKVLVATNINPKLVGGNYNVVVNTHFTKHHNDNSNASLMSDYKTPLPQHYLRHHFYFNHETQAENSFLKV